jgi:hypothetical protein
MKRRNFIAGLAGAWALRPNAVGAQRPQRNVPLVGVNWLGTASDQIPVRVREAFLRGLRENGFTAGLARAENFATILGTASQQRGETK